MTKLLTLTLIFSGLLIGCKRVEPQEQPAPNPIEYQKTLIPKIYEFNHGYNGFYMYVVEAENHKWIVTRVGSGVNTTHHPDCEKCKEIK